MKPGIYLTKIWFDDDIIELKIEVSDGISIFSNKVYVGYQTLDDVIASLIVYREQIRDSLLDIRFGEFGPKYANGAFHAHLQFASPGELYITCRMEYAFNESPIKNVASEATLYLKTEPVLLDNFIAELKLLNAKKRDDASLEGI